MGNRLLMPDPPNADAPLCRRSALQWRVAAWGMSVRGNPLRPGGWRYEALGRLLVNPIAHSGGHVQHFFAWMGKKMKKSLARAGARLFSLSLSPLGGAGEGGQDKSLAMRRQTSSTFSRLLKAEMRKKPSPCAPKPAPGVMTTRASCSILSKNSQLPMPLGVCTQT